MAFYTHGQTEMYYEEIGEGIPFLLVHGWAIDHRFLKKCMEPIFSSLDKKFRRIYVDLPGMGLSKPGEVRNGDDITEVLISFMDDIAKDQSYYICGNSFGSVVARSMTARLGRRVKGLILIAPAADKKSDVAVNGVNCIDEEFMNSLDADDKDKFIYMHANLNRETYDRYREYVYPSVEINEANEYMHHKLKGKFGMDINKAIVKSDYDGPTLLLTGKNDRAVGYKEQFTWLDIFKRATYIVIDGAGHNIHVDRPDVFRDTIQGFINQYI